MNDSFDQRRKSFEDKWAHDEELHCKVHARRDRRLEEWAPQQSAVQGGERDAYVKSVVHTELSKGGEHAVARKLHADFAAKEIRDSEHMIHKKMEELLKVAGDQILHETNR